MGETDLWLTGTITTLYTGTSTRRSQTRKSRLVLAQDSPKREYVNLADFWIIVFNPALEIINNDQTRGNGFADD